MHNIAQGGYAEGDSFYSIENLSGTSHADDLWGDIHDNVIQGHGGNDTLKGFGGEDTLYGGSGNDVLHGGSGDDTLFGASGNDTLYGGEGYADWLEGGIGADLFVWSNAQETGWSASTADIVADFNHAQGDLLDVSGIDADLSAAGNQAFTFIANAAFSGNPGEIRYSYVDGDTLIEMQTGTTPDADVVIRLDGIHMPAASWFVL
jgi:Ca2+-binding RTX toxin-like protein